MTIALVIALKTGDWFDALHQREAHEQRDGHEHAEPDKHNRVVVRRVEDCANGPGADH